MKSDGWFNGKLAIFDAKGTQIEPGDKVVYTKSLDDRLLFGTVVEIVTDDNQGYKKLAVSNNGKTSFIWTAGPRPYRLFVYEKA